MTGINPFSSVGGFDLATVCKAINRLPNNYGRLNQLNLMPDVGVSTRTIIIERKNGFLTLLPSLPVGSPGTVAKHEKRDMRPFVIPHIPHDDFLLPEALQGIRGFGSDSETDPVNDVLMDRLAKAKAKHDITKEFLRVGALKGIILDGDGVTTLYNLYTEFSITQKTVDFVLGTPGTNVLDKVLEVKRHIDDNLMGETADGVRALVSQEFFGKLVSHATVKDAYARWRDGEALRSDMRSEFVFGGIIFEEYRGNAPSADGTARRMIAANDGQAFPTGTTGTFATYCAPADFNETVNTIGLPYYAKVDPRQFNRGFDIHTQSNILPMCHRPEILVRIFSSN